MPWIAATPLDDAAFAHLRRRAIFDCCKWDPQVGDACVIARAPLVITKQALERGRPPGRSAGGGDARGGSRVDRPARAAQAARPASRGASRASAPSARAAAPRELPAWSVSTFTSRRDGWRISEANCDVPGGLNEASGFPPLVAAHYPWAAPVGDPSAAYVAALSRALDGRGTVALIHATAYSDDHQMMRFVARGLAEARARRRTSPARAILRWRDGARPARGRVVERPARSRSCASFPPTGWPACRRGPDGRIFTPARTRRSAIRRRRC